MFLPLGRFSLSHIRDENFRGHYDSPCYHRPISDVDSCIEVSVASMTARETAKVGLALSILRGDMPTRTAFARTISRIDDTKRNAGEFSFVCNESTKLAEGPIANPCSLTANGRDPIAGKSQVFYYYPALGAFSVQNERLRNFMVGLFLEPPLFSRKFSQSALGCLCPTLLKSSPSSGKMDAPRFYGFSRINDSVAINRNVGYTKINSKPISNVKFFCFGHIACCCQIPFIADKAQINLAFLKLKKAALCISNHYWHGNSSGHCPDAGGIIPNSEDASIVRLGRIFSKLRRFITACFKGIGHFCYSTDSHLRRKAEFAPYLSIG